MGMMRGNRGAAYFTAPATMDVVIPTTRSATCRERTSRECVVSTLIGICVGGTKSVPDRIVSSTSSRTSSSCFLPPPGLSATISPRRLAHRDKEKATRQGYELLNALLTNEN